MNINRINLNLLKVFMALIQEQHVSATAKRLHLTQSAISNSLQQLRELFHDDLLIRGPKKMIPTQKALQLAPKIEQVLHQLETVIFYSGKFEHKTSDRTFNLGMSDYSEYVLLPKIYQQVKKLAPNISLKVLSYSEFKPEDFESARIELGIGLVKKFPRQLKFEKLLTDKAVCVGRSNNPIFKQKLTLETYLQAEHLAVCVYAAELPRPDQALSRMKLVRNIKVSIPDILPALETLATSDLIGTLSRNLVRQSAKKYHLKYIDIPFPVDDLPVAQIWHRQQESDEGLLWLRNLIKSICHKDFPAIR